MQLGWVEQGAAVSLAPQSDTRCSHPHLELVERAQALGLTHLAMDGHRAKPQVAQQQRGLARGVAGAREDLRAAKSTAQLVMPCHVVSAFSDNDASMLPQWQLLLPVLRAPCWQLVQQGTPARRDNAGCAQLHAIQQPPTMLVEPDSSLSTCAR
jgi:hypothetical protein